VLASAIVRAAMLHHDIIRSCAGAKTTNALMVGGASHLDNEAPIEAPAQLELPERSADSRLAYR
jgi:hypothetical protein